MHECTKEEEIGKIKEFIDSLKGYKTILFSIIFAIIIQVVSFSFLWGRLSTTVEYHDKILAKLDKIQIVAFVGEQGIQGLRGLTGAAGKDYGK